LFRRAALVKLVADGGVDHWVQVQHIAAAIWPSSCLVQYCFLVCLLGKHKLNFA